MKFFTLKRKKLRTVLRNFILAEGGAYLVFMLLALATNWAKLYRDHVFVARYLPFEIVEFSFLGFFQLVLILFFFVRVKISDGENDLMETLRAGEHEQLEFKTSFRWDEKRQQVNKELEKAVLKTVAAFLNSDGGHLFVGVNDQGQPLGLETDFTSLPKPNQDGFENHFNNLFNQMIGPEFRRLVKLNFNQAAGKTICLINIEPSPKPAYFKNGDSEDFYIRTGNTTTSLKMSEATAYLSSWRKK